MPMFRLSGLRLSFVDELKTSRSPKVIRPSSGVSRPARQRSVVVLPQPLGPEQDEELALLDVEVEVVHRGRRRLAGELLGQALHAQVRHSCTPSAIGLRPPCGASPVRGALSLSSRRALR